MSKLEELKAVLAASWAPPQSYGQKPVTQTKSSAHQAQHDEHLQAAQHAFGAAMDHHHSGHHEAAAASFGRAKEHLGKARELQKKLPKPAMYNMVGA